MYHTSIWDVWQEERKYVFYSVGALFYNALAILWKRVQGVEEGSGRYRITPLHSCVRLI